MMRHLVPLPATHGTKYCEPWWTCAHAWHGNFDSQKIFERVFQNTFPTVMVRASVENFFSIVTPRGGPPPPTFSCPGHGSRRGLRGCTLGVCTLKMVGLLSIFGILACLVFLEGFRGETIPKIHGNPFQMQSWRLQNQVLGPPKSSLEASKTQFVKDL